MKVTTLIIALSSLLVVSGNAFAGEKVDVCHKGKETINISRNAVQAHLNHGDERRACGSIPRAIALFRCGGADIKILSVSTSSGVPQSEGLLAIDSSCSESIRFLVNKGYTPTHTDSVYNANLLGIVTDYGYSGPRESVIIAP